MKQTKPKEVTHLRDWLTAVRRQDLHHVELWNRGEQPKRLVLWFTALPDDVKAAEAEIVAAAESDAAQAPGDRALYLVEAIDKNQRSLGSQFFEVTASGKPVAPTQESSQLAFVVPALTTLVKDVVSDMRQAFEGRDKGYEVILSKFQIMVDSLSARLSQSDASRVQTLDLLERMKTLELEQRQIEESNVRAREREKFLMNMANAYVPSVVSKYLASGTGAAPKGVEADPMYPLIGALFASFTAEQGVDVMQGKPIVLREDQRLLFGQAIDRFVELQRKRATINGSTGGQASEEPSA
jgi:hypothetical protein